VPSLQVRHQRPCEGYPGKSAKVETANDELCTCRPSYRGIITSGEKGGRESLGKSRREAERWLRRTEAMLDEGKDPIVKPVRFEQFADDWKAGLRRPKASTLKSYESTIGYAKETFGQALVKELRLSHVQAFLRKLDEEKLSESTKAKHLRVLGAMFREAVQNRYLAENPIDRLGRAQRPTGRKKKPVYFEDSEIPRIIAALDPFDRPLFRFAFATGIRSSALLALTWADVDLARSEVRIVDDKTESGSRTIYLVPEAVQVLKKLREGVLPHPLTLVFPREDGSQRPPDHPRDRLYAALKRAKIKREGPPQGNKRDFHSIRHTFARIALEHGAEMSWLKEQMGHSSINVTVDLYGQWSNEARKAQAERLEGVFNVNA
jgi:integrase